MRNGNSNNSDSARKRFSLRATGLLRKAAGVLALLGLLAGANHAASGELTFSEYQVKAMFLFNFAKYVEWPSDVFTDTNAPITIGVLGENRFGDELQKVVAGKNVSGRTIVLRQVENANDASKCHILFISASEKNRLGEILGKIKGLPVLTVGETEQFTGQGGIINFMRKEDKVRLEIDLNAARQAKLQLSSKLLSVADVVKGKP